MQSHSGQSPYLSAPQVVAAACRFCHPAAVEPGTYQLHKSIAEISRKRQSGHHAHSHDLHRGGGSQLNPVGNVRGTGVFSGADLSLGRRDRVKVLDSPRSILYPAHAHACRQITVDGIGKRFMRWGTHVLGCAPPRLNETRAYRLH